MRGKHYKNSHAVLSFYFNMEPAAMAPGDVAASKEVDASYPTFMRWVAGETACPPEKLAAIYTVTKYAPILQVLAPEGHRIVPVAPASPDKMTVEEEIMDDICSASDACKLWRQSLADNKFTERERIKMLCALEQQRDELEQTIALVKSYPGVTK